MKKVFVGHSERDKYYAAALVNLLRNIGMPKSSETIFCSLIPGVNVHSGQNFADRIGLELNRDCVTVIFVVSDNFVNSNMCIVDAGRIILGKRDCITAVVPSFKFDCLP